MSQLSELSTPHKQPRTEEGMELLFNRLTLKRMYAYVGMLVYVYTTKTSRIINKYCILCEAAPLSPRVSEFGGFP